MKYQNGAQRWLQISSEFGERHQLFQLLEKKNEQINWDKKQIVETKNREKEVKVSITL